ncbi:MAG TPA: GNAT family N-acetyltransferase [Bryobacteraceae bacterium]|nr:GNAT family N-acetyltransferase [Bryobacteraceae bacterium]
MSEPCSAAQVRLLTTADIPAGVRLKAAAGWNQTEADWRNVLALAPDGCFGINYDGDLRATATAVCFGPELAWIGMVLTQHEYRGRGFARRLMEHALAYLRARQVDWIKLDATNMGLPLYERLGFRAEAAIERWLRAPAPAPVYGTTLPYAPNTALDRAASGTDRGRLLAVLAGFESASISGAFAMGRPGSQAAYFGPCVARSAGAARDLIAWFLNRHAGDSVYWDILPANQDAVAIAREFGFARARELVRMAIPGVESPAPLANNNALVFATAGFEFG